MVLYENGQQEGPVSTQLLIQMAANGQLLRTDLVWKEGMSDWLPAGQVQGLFTAPRRIRPATTTAPPRSQHSVPLRRPARAPRQPTLTQRLYSEPKYEYAHIFERLAAFIIDYIILSICSSAFALIVLLAYTILRLPEPDLILIFVSSFISYVIYWLYFSILECSDAQGTFGKQILGLKVTDLRGRPIGFGRASARFWGKILSILICAAGFIIIVYSNRRQGFHDTMAGTMVLRKKRRRY